MFENVSFNSSNASVSQFIYGNKTLWTVAFSVQFFFAMIGNPLIVWIVYKEKRLKTTTNYLVANMAVSDFLSSLFGHPLTIADVNNTGQWQIRGEFGNVFCKLFVLILHSSVTVSLYSCIILTIDRYYAVAHPMKKPFQSKLKYIIAGIWILSGLLHSPRLYFFGTYKKGDQIYCGTKENLLKPYSLYNWIALASTFPLAGPVVTIIYTVIVYKLYRHKVPGEQSDVMARRRVQQNKKILKMCVTIVSLFYFSSGWLYVFATVKNRGEREDRVSYYDLYFVSKFMMYMSFVYNFFIYLIFNNIYRENIRSIFHCADVNVKKNANKSKSVHQPAETKT